MTLVFSPKKVLSILVLSIGFWAVGVSALDKYQTEMLQYAFVIGGPTEVFIIEQESSLCKHRVGDHGTAFGCGQIHCEAARVVLRRCPIHRLIYDNRFNIRVSAAYYTWCFNKTGEFGRALICYNKGLRYARECRGRCIRDNQYVRHIEERMVAFYKFYEKNQGL